MPTIGSIMEVEIKRLGAFIVETEVTHDESLVNPLQAEVLVLVQSAAVFFKERVVRPFFPRAFAEDKRGDIFSKS